MSTAAARTEHELHMLERLVDGAYAMAVAFSEAAKAERDTAAMLKLFDAYHRASQSVRLGIRLSMALRAPARATAADASAPADAEPLEVEKDDSVTRPERPERAEGLERERDYESVSLARFLASLGVVAAETERLADHLPPEVASQTLPALRGLLAQAKAAAAPLNPAASPIQARPAYGAGGLAVLARPPAAPKSVLLSSASSPPRPIDPGGGPRPPPPRR